MSTSTSMIEALANQEYKYGFITDVEADAAPRGLNEDIVRLISAKKKEPEFMLAWRLKAYRHWVTLQKSDAEPRWANISYPPIDYQDIVYYSAPRPKKTLTSLDERQGVWIHTTQAAELQVEAERFRNALLSAVSHDLRTPLAAVTGAASTLLDRNLDRVTHDELARTVAAESARLSRLIGDILQVTRLESGAVRLEKEWQPLEESLGAALSRVEEQLGDRPVAVEISPEPLLVPADGLLLEQLFYNLLENAAKYTPPGSPITVRAWTEPGWALVEVADRGPGLPAGGEQKAFDTFVRLAAGGRGVGLGLTICRGIVLAHGGTIWAENQPSGGVAFRFRLPIETEPPTIEPEEADDGLRPEKVRDGSGE